MAVEQSVATLDGLFKDQFHKDLENLLPDHVLLQKGMVDWVPSDKLNGEFYSVPTVLKSNQGVTYFGETGAAGTLEAAIAGEMKEAQVKGSEMVLRGRLSYKALSQAATAGSRAFKKSSAWLVEDLAQVAANRLEISALYGQSGAGTISTYAFSSTFTIVLTEDSFAPGIWVCSEGAQFTVTDEAATGAAVGSALVLTVTGVTVSTRTLVGTVSGSGTPDADDVLHFKSANTGTNTWAEMVGLYKQITATSGTLFNINKASYALYRGNEKSSTGALTKAKVIDAAMLTVDHGNMGDLICLVSTKGWAKLAQEDMALRSFDGSYSKERSESGSKELAYSYVGGNITVVCHPMVKYGHAFLFNADNIIWVGSSKPTFEIPGMGEKFFRLVENANAVELQNYSDCAIYALKPAHCCVMTGITYS